VRPLSHPAAEDISVEGILHALADPVRVHIFAQLLRADHPLTCSEFLEVPGKVIPKSTLSQHFKVLRDSGLIRSERKGVEMRSVVRSEDLGARFGPLIGAIVDAHQAQGTRERRRRRSAAKV
jgi:DNA-binding transcriptional ArsR family regulator